MLKLIVENDDLFKDFLVTLEPNLQNLIKKENINEYLLNIDPIIQFDSENVQDRTFLLIHISIYLLMNYISTYFNDDKNKEVLLKHVLQDDYFRTLVVAEIERYFVSNTTLKEKVFIIYNLNGLESDLKLILNEIESKKQIDMIYKNLIKTMKDSGIDINFYKKVKLLYKEDEICLVSLKNPKYVLKPSNISDMIPIEIELFDIEDILIRDVTFVSILISLLKIEEIQLSKIYEEIYDLIKEQIEMNDSKTIIKLI